MRRFVLGALLVFAVMVLPASAAAGSHWTDPTGDSGTAPDITTVDVSNDGAGNITFAIGFSPPTIASYEGLGVYIDGDQNTATGNRQGADYVVFVYQASSDFYSWKGSSFAPVASNGPISVSRTATGVTITINKAALGGVSAFRFWVESQKASAMGNTLAASDLAGVYTYALTTFAKVIVSLKPASAAKGVHPGSKFAIIAGVGLSDGTTAAADSVSCKATVGSTPLPAAGTCAWTVPKTARGKMVVVTIAVGYGGTSHPTRLSVRVLQK